MATFEDFLSEGKKLQIKRKYTENHPAKTVGKTANVRNAVLQAIKDGVVTREEFNKILSELSADSRQWSSRNRKYFNVSEEGIKLSKWGRRILAELDETPKAAEINEKIKVTKDKFPYIEFKDGGKKYEVEFEQGDIIDDHGNEGKDWYYVGLDQNGDEWEIDVYTDYRNEPEDWFHDTIKRANESVVTEAKEPFTFSEKEVKDAADLIAKAISKMDKVKAEVHDMDYADGKGAGFEISMDGEKYDGGSYDVRPNGDVVNVAIGNSFPNAVYTKIGDKNLNQIIKNIKKFESVVTENYEVIYSDRISQMKKFRREAQAIDFMKKEIASNKKLKNIAVYKPGMHSTTQTELVVKFWGDGSYLDNVSKRDKDLAAKKLEENTNKDMKNEVNLFESFGDFIASNGILNEAINSAIFRSILMNGKEGKHAKKNMSALAKGFYGLSKVALDKIEDEDFIVSNDPGKVFKNYGGNSHVLFFISDNEKENPYYDRKNGSWNDYKVVPGGGILLAAMSGDRQFYTNEWSRWAGGRTWSKNKKGDEGQIGINHKYRGWGASGLNNGKRVAEMSDRVIVLNLELVRQKYSTDQLRSARAEAKAGATAFKSDKDFKDGNMARYHKILADKAASLPLDKMVQDAIDTLAKQISDGLAKGEKTQYQEIKIGESPKGREVKARDASQHMSNILDDYARYVDYIRQAEESEARYGERESYYERESKNYAKRVQEKIKKIEKFDYAW